MTVDAGKENGEASRLCTEIYEQAISGGAVRVDTEDIVSVGWEVCCFHEGIGKIVLHIAPETESSKPSRASSAAPRGVSIEY